MKAQHVKWMIVSFGMILFLNAQKSSAEPAAASMITYQGQLKLEGAPVDEPCEYVFSLYDDPAGGDLVAQYGSPEAPVVVNVSKGVFTAMLNFGDGAFDGGERWLEVAVRRAADFGPFTVLAPRQCLTPAPYAVHALTGGDPTSLDEAYNKGGPGEGRTVHTTSGPMSLEGPGGLHVAGNVGIGINDPVEKLELDGSLRLHQGGIIFPDGSVLSTAFAGGAAGEDGEPRAGHHWDDTVNEILFVNPLNTRVGIGTNNPLSPLHVVGPIRASAYASNSPWMAQAPPGVTRLFINDVSGHTALGHTNPQRAPQSLLHLADDNQDPIITLETNPDGSMSPAFAGIDFTDSTNVVGGLLGDIFTAANVPGFPDGLVFNAFSDANSILNPIGGRVGIGTATPGRKFHLRDTNVQFARFTGAHPNAAVVEFHSESAGHSWEFSVSGSAGAFGGFLPAGTAYIYHQFDHIAMTFNPNNGFVGVGPVATPMARLHIGGTPGADGIRFPDGTLQTTAAVGGITEIVAGVGLTGGGTSGVVTLDVDFAGTGVADTVARSDHTHDSIGDEIFVVGGNVGIGTMTPMHKLDVDGDIHASGKVLASAFSSNSPWIAEAPVGVERMLINDTTGNVSIASPPVPDPGERLVVDGNVDISGLVRVDVVTSHSPLELQTSGTTRVFIDDVTGNVGIDTTTPAQQLHVSNNARVDGTVYTEMVSSQGDPLHLKTDDTVRVHIDDVTGNVGIDTTTPAQQLHVSNNARVDGTVYTEMVSSQSDPLQLKTDDTVRVHIDDVTGNVGLDTTTPAQQLHVSNNARVDGTVYTEMVSSQGDPLQLKTDDTVRVHIDDVTGFVGIDTMTPDEQLHVVNNVRVDGTVYTEMVSSQNAPLELKTDDVTHIFIDDATGNVGVGSPPPIPPEEALHVNGCVKADCFKVNGEKPIEVSALTAVTNSALTMIPTPNGTMRLRPNQTGTQNVLIPVHVASSILGTPQELVRVRVCYRVASSLSFINNTRARTTQDNGSFVTLLEDTTDRKSIPWACYEVDLPMPEAIDGPLYLQLELTIGGTGSSHDVEVGRVTVTVVDA